MPELPEVETMVRDLRPLLVGRQITEVQITRENMVGGRAVAQKLTALLPGRKFIAVERRAKIVLFYLNDGALLTYAPRMTGQFTYSSQKEPVAKHTRIVFNLDSGKKLEIQDIRTFGRLIYYPQTNEATFVRLGPEPFSSAAREKFLNQIDQRPWAKKPLKEILLDQSFVVGIGNIYADEILWQARLSPRRRGAELTVTARERLYQVSVEILQTAIAARGSSVSDYRSLGVRGQMQAQLQVYGRVGSPCQNCGQTLRRTVIGGRGTVFCATCQA
jgi:formamidopyrimidine-DNA glycosylase